MILNVPRVFEDTASCDELIPIRIFCSNAKFGCILQECKALVIDQFSGVKQQHNENHGITKQKSAR